MLTGLLLGVFFAALYAVVEIIDRALEKRTENKTLDEWEVRHPTATKEEVEAERQCLWLLRRGGLLQRIRMRSWRKQNPNASAGDIASEILEWQAQSAKWYVLSGVVIFAIVILLVMVNGR